ncbi:MAG TPA: hypothetical protein VIL05_07710 [Thermoclostridium sp.]
MKDGRLFEFFHDVCNSDVFIKPMDFVMVFTKIRQSIKLHLLIETLIGSDLSMAVEKMQSLPDALCRKRNTYVEQTYNNYNGLYFL